MDQLIAAAAAAASGVMALDIGLYLAKHSVLIGDLFANRTLSLEAGRGLISLREQHLQVAINLNLSN